MAQQTGAALSEIVDGVKKVAVLIAEISAAAQEQAKGIEQINQAITQMDSVTQQNRDHKPVSFLPLPATWRPER